MKAKGYKVKQLINMTLEEKVELYKQLEIDLKQASRGLGVDLHLKPLLRNYKKIKYPERSPGYPTLIKRGLGWYSGYIYAHRNQTAKEGIQPYFFSINRNTAWAGRSLNQLVRCRRCTPLQKTVHHRRAK